MRVTMREIMRDLAEIGRLRSLRRSAFVAENPREEHMRPPCEMSPLVQTRLPTYLAVLVYPLGGEGGSDPQGGCPPVPNCWQLGFPTAEPGRTFAHVVNDSGITF